MKWGMLALAGLITMSAISANALVIAQEKPSTPAEPQLNDVRPPIAKINPKKPIQIRVISQTNVPVVASSLQASSDRILSPGQTVTFGRLHTSYLSLPINLLISLQDNPDPKKPTGLSLDVKTSGNEIIVGVKTSISVSGSSARAINVDKKGLIYLF